MLYSKLSSFIAVFLNTYFIYRRHKLLWNARVIDRWFLPYLWGQRLSLNIWPLSSLLAYWSRCVAVLLAIKKWQIFYAAVSDNCLILSSVKQNISYSCRSFIIWCSTFLVYDDDVPSDWLYNVGWTGWQWITFLAIAISESIRRNYLKLGFLIKEIIVPKWQIFINRLN